MISSNGLPVPKLQYLTPAQVLEIDREYGKLVQITTNNPKQIGEITIIVKLGRWHLIEFTVRRKPHSVKE